MRVFDTVACPPDGRTCARRTAFPPARRSANVVADAPAVRVASVVHFEPARRSEPSPPVAGATHSPPWPRVKAIERPSGDQVGPESLGPELTTRTSWAVAAE